MALVLTLWPNTTLWPKTGSAPGGAAVATADDQRRDAALAANALRAAAALRTEERASRDRTKSGWTQVSRSPCLQASIMVFVIDRKRTDQVIDNVIRPNLGLIIRRPCDGTDAGWGRPVGDRAPA